VRHNAHASHTSAESIEQRRDLVGAKGELDRARRKLDRTERALDSLSRILTLIPYPIEVVSTDYTVLFANRASRLLHDNEGLEGSYYYESVMGLERPAEDCPIRKAVDDDREAGYTAACDNGDIFEVTVTPIVLSDGRRAAMCLSRQLPSQFGEAGDRPPAEAEPGGPNDILEVDEVLIDEILGLGDGIVDRGAPEGTPVSPDESAQPDESAEREHLLLQKIAELSTQTLDVVLDQVTDGVLMIDVSGRVVLCNAAMREMAGIESGGALDAETVSRMLLPGRRAGTSPAAELAETAAGDGPARFETSLARPGGERVPVEMAVSRVPGDPADETVLLVTVRDLRERNTIKEQLVKALILSRAGERTAGLAHQANNYLTPALYHADKLAQRDNLDRKTRQSVATIQNYLNLCHESISMVLSLNRPAVASAVNMNRLVSEVFSRQYLADELRLDNVEVVQRYDPGMVETIGYPMLLRQALANIIKNAQEAMVEAGGGGRLMVLTEASPKTITIRISDDGPGIPADIQKRMFDLFFTSKLSGEGRGIGLHFAREVISRHGGTIEVKSRPGEGATFVVRLPVRRPPASSVFDEAAFASPAAPPAIHEAAGREEGVPYVEKPLSTEQVHWVVRGVLRPRAE
jgi:PAS domain S-box-containing protein